MSPALKDVAITMTAGQSKALMLNDKRFFCLFVFLIKTAPVPDQGWLIVMVWKKAKTIENQFDFPESENLVVIGLQGTSTSQVSPS